MNLIIKQALIFIDKNLHKNLTLQEVAKHSNISYNYFSNLFKQEMGISYSKYLIRMRIKKSKELLKENYLSIKQISYRVGYKHPSNFNHDFKKIVGLSPSAYRRRYKKRIFKRLKYLAVIILKFIISIIKNTKRIIKFAREK